MFFHVTVRAYWPPEPERRRNGRTCSQNWRTFVRNHAQSIVACDFLVMVTTRFRTLYVFLLNGGRDTAHRALQRHRASNVDLDFAAASRSDSERSFSPFLIRDRDAVFSAEVDLQLRAFWTAGAAHACACTKGERLLRAIGGKQRRECLDFMIPLGEKHLRRILAEWVTHYNQGRPHFSLGPGTPEPAAAYLPLQGQDRHSLAQDCKVVARADLGGLHEYQWERIAA